MLSRGVDIDGDGLAWMGVFTDTDGDSWSTFDADNRWNWLNNP